MAPLPRFTPRLALAAATAVVLTGCDAGTERGAEMDTDTLAERPAMDRRTADQEIYEARLQPLRGSGVSGTATFTVEGDELQVTMAATGLNPNQRVPMHIHVNATCEDAGGMFLNLDDELSAPNEGEPRGEAYPQAGEQGRLQFEASRSLSDLSRAVRGDRADTTRADTGRDASRLDTAAARAGRAGTGERAQRGGASQLNLGERVVKLHNPEMQGIACGALDRMQHDAAAAGARQGGDRPE